METIDLFGVFEEEDGKNKTKKRQSPFVNDSSISKSPRIENVGPQVNMLGEGNKKIVHQIVLPDDGEVQPAWAPGSEPAKKYSFELDPFQLESIKCLELGESVLVSAHTSAGKTVVAEYAIAMALRSKQRVIYTSPIKALSNQKYRDLQKEFGDVGLMTGDVTMNPNASCLVMTTEILRSMLYRGNEILREVSWVIYDEIHYMRDLERGVVWEESIIMLPHKVRYVFLSATIPNGIEFAGWIANLHKQKMNVIFTEYRPTPLSYYIYPSGAEGLFLVMDDTGNFRENTYSKAIANLGLNTLEQQTVQKGKNKKITTQSNLKRILTLIMEKKYDPVIVFSFSKRECESYGNIISQDCYTTENEQKLIKYIYNNAIEELSEDDKKLPQVSSMLPLLLNGVAIHHGGLLPILKEIIEILFQEGLIKVLFATETFAMGVNMPAKTVVFTALKKFDGTNLRLLTSGEYIQMSGRAGRRGKDRSGIVIQMMDEGLDPNDVRSILKGSADPLNSSFYLGFNMLLNLLRVEEANPEYLILNSFYQYQMRYKAPQVQQQMNEIINQLNNYVISNEAIYIDYYRHSEKIIKLKTQINSIIHKSQAIINFIQPGRLIRVSLANGISQWGCALSLRKENIIGGFILGSENGEISNFQYIVDCLLPCTSNEQTKTTAIETDNATSLMSVPALLFTLYDISTILLKIPSNLKQSSSLSKVFTMLNETRKRLKNDIPILHPINDMKINDSNELKGLLENLESEQKLFKQITNVDINSPEYKNYIEKVKLQQQQQKLSVELKNSQEIALSKELRSMKSVLRRLGYIDDNDVILMKGKVTCELNTSDELLLTELIFENVISNLTVQQICGLLSLLVYEEKNEDNPRIPADMKQPISKLQNCARKVAEVMHDCGMNINVEEYVQKFNPGLVDVVYGWADGQSFHEICTKNKNVFEGSVIRSIRRLEELLRQLSDAAHAVGNTEMENQFNSCIYSIKRDIVFAASLYLN